MTRAWVSDEALLDALGAAIRCGGEPGERAEAWLLRWLSAWVTGWCATGPRVAYAEGQGREPAELAAEILTRGGKGGAEPPLIAVARRWATAEARPADLRLTIVTRAHQQAMRVLGDWTGLGETGANAACAVQAEGVDAGQPYIAIVLRLAADRGLTARFADHEGALRWLATALLRPTVATDERGPTSSE